MGAGQRPLVGPDLATVELGDEGEEAVRGSMDVGGEGGDGGGERVVVHDGEIVGEYVVNGDHGTRKIDEKLKRNYITSNLISSM